MEEEIEKYYHENGQLGYEIPYLNGNKHGFSRGWFENGQIWYEVPYKNGNRYGLERYWHSNGQLRYETPYINGEVHGLVKHWFYGTIELHYEIPHKKSFQHGARIIFEY